MRNLKILSPSKSQPILPVQKTDSGNEKSFGKLLGNWLDEWCLPVFVVLFLLGDALVACLGLPAAALKFLLGAVLVVVLLSLCLRQYRFLCCVGFLLGMIWCGLPLAAIESFSTAAYHSMDFTGKWWKFMMKKPII